jgi:hypothetical protein
VDANHVMLAKGFEEEMNSIKTTYQKKAKCV